ncbi:excinuclease ABC subunit B [Flavobacterium rivuli WB 3.3-2 = DSM 21788]|uniref:Excinuclease ABC subunit B n=1 Tax=Flavobacterium rivuli WB 3.3-2 = DSM 21788 TaxID=1121895 RepID=A0A0A2M081_9FLAO|nr:ABC transporter permease subunit [Flavobacterium rivuli]KGO85011.1 excinuclease ABC subunit B [Flavobacterium rivuli WB 3.3-2 = DSM 21788]
MKRLISIEFQKLWKNRSSKVLILSYFIILSFIALIASVKLDFFGMEFKLADQGIFNFPYIWHFNTYVAVYLKAFLAIVIVSMMANEYTYGTLKQNLIDGLSKKEIIQSKFLVVFLFALSSTVFIFLLTLILGYSFSSFTEISIVFQDIAYLGAFFLDLLAFFSFCLFAGILIKRSAFAIGFIVVWYLAEWITYGFLLNKVFNNMDLTNKVTGYFPLISISNLIVEPVTRFKAYKAIETQMNANALPKDYSIHWDNVIVVIVWTIIFMLMSYRILKKRDL